MRVCNWLVPLVFAAAASGAMAATSFFLVVPIPVSSSSGGSGGSGPGGGSGPTDPPPQEPTSKPYAFNLEVLPGPDGEDKWRLTDAIAGSLYILYSSNNYVPDGNPPGMTGTHNFYAYRDGGIYHGDYYQEVFSRGTGAVPQLNEDPAEGSITYRSQIWWGSTPGIPAEGYNAFALHLPYSSFKNGSQEFVFNADYGLHPSSNFYCLKFVEKDGMLTDGQLLSGACH